MKVRYQGRIVELSEDPATAKKQMAEYSAQWKKEAASAPATSTYSSPTPQNKKLYSDELIEKRYMQCREQEDQAVADGDKDTPDYGPCESFKQKLIKENELKRKEETIETSKNTTPDPVPSDKVIPTTIPNKTESGANENGVTTSTEVEPKPEPEPKTTPTVSSPSGDVPVSTTNPAQYKQQAASNKISEKVHIANSQKYSKENHSEVLVKTAENLIPIETEIASGGNQIISYEKDKHEFIGAVINTFPSIRKDTSGEFRPKSISIEGKGAFVQHAPVSYTEEVENTRFPCGTYSLNVGNKYDVSVGAGGANISTTGNMRVGSGGRTIISAAEEMNISSGNGNTNIKARHNVSLEGDSVTLEAPNQVVVNTNLGVSKNAIINGCAFVDGELYINHITCPAEVQYTGGGMGSFGQLMTGAGANGSSKGIGGGAIIGFADVSYIKRLYESIRKCNIFTCISKESWNLPDKIPVMVCPDGGVAVASNVGNTGIITNPEYSVFVYPHEHPFNNVPISFTKGNESMRARASVLNSGNVGTAAPIQHGYKTPL
jgi:hypothetical protein